MKDPNGFGHRCAEKIFPSCSRTRNPDICVVNRIAYIQIGIYYSSDCSVTGLWNLLFLLDRVICFLRKNLHVHFMSFSIKQLGV